jgi:hypothetical protein
MTSKKEADVVKILEQDPPIIVGGGGSAFVWIKRDIATLITDLSTIPASAPHPGHQKDYIVYKIGVDLTLAVVSKGNGDIPATLSGMNPKKHSTVFDT